MVGSRWPHSLVRAIKETDVLFSLLSYTRCYWRKSLSRKTMTEAAVKSQQKNSVFSALHAWCQAALALQQVLKHNPRRARPSKRKQRLPAADGPKCKKELQDDIDARNISIKPGCSRDLEVWQCVDSSDSEESVVEMATSHDASVAAKQACFLNWHGTQVACLI